MSISNNRLTSIVGAVFLVTICFVAVPPVAQDPRYHEFADARTFHFVPNFWNVISNLPFFVVALYGSKNLRLRLAFDEPWERFAYCVLLAGTAAVGGGSIYYHLEPTDARLVWDRLPMTVVFMSLLAVAVGERVSMKAGKLLLLPMILLGLGSVLYWRSSGDLRPYCAVQFGSMLAMPFILARFPSRYSASGCVWGTVLLYALAKVVELKDHEIASWIATGGHPWKHLIAAGAVFLYAIAIGRRRPQEMPFGALGVSSRRLPGANSAVAHSGIGAGSASEKIGVVQ